MFVVLVRHAEPVAGGTDPDPGLSTTGKKRAVTLAKMLADAGITAIFTSDLRRTKETAKPLANQLSITPVEIAADPLAAAAQIRAAGDRVLVVGHTNTVPPIIKALGGPPNVVIDHNEFDRLFVLQVPAQGAASLLSMRYRA
jgi:phosphohistidine phosphatase SixA